MSCCSVRTLTSFETRLLLLKVLWGQDLQQRVEEGHVGQLADQNQRLRGKNTQSDSGHEVQFAHSTGMKTFISQARRYCQHFLEQQFTNADERGQCKPRP